MNWKIVMIFFAFLTLTSACEEDENLVSNVWVYNSGGKFCGFVSGADCNLVDCYDSCSDCLCENEIDYSLNGGLANEDADPNSDCSLCSNKCTNLTYNGPTEGQAKQWCQYAQFLECNGLISERDVQCQILKDFDVSCPYCN